MTIRDETKKPDAVLNQMNIVKEETPKNNQNSPEHNSFSPRRERETDVEMRVMAIDQKMPNNSSMSAEDDMMMAEIHVEDRAKRNCVYSFFFAVVTSVTFNFLIYCFILANTITLALYRFDQSDK